MKYICIAIIGILLGFGTRAKACDVCNIYEYKPYNSSGNYVGIFYHYKKFNGYKHLNQSHNFFDSDPKMHDFEGSGVFLEREQQDFEVYQTTAARFNINIRGKVNVLFIMPYEFAHVYNETVWSITEPVKDTTMLLQGPGDLISAVDYTFNFNKNNKSHIIRPGIAVKWPTGTFTEKTSNGELFDPEIQPGSGSIDLIFRLNYLNLSSSGFGHMYSVNYKWNGPSKQDYVFSDSFNAQVDLFYQIDLLFEKYLTPKIGIYMESSGYNSFNGEKDLLTGGTTYLLDLGLDFQIKRFTIQTLFQPVLYDDRNGRQIGNAGRFNAGIIYAW